jgi:tetratricopeptide (TPR) repeat protein
VVYRPDQAAAVASLIGSAIDDKTMYTDAMRTAQLELSYDRNDAFGWFNLGSSLTGLGRYDDAASAFDEARRIGLPARFLWYQFTIYDAYLKVGNAYIDQVLALADDVLRGKASEEAFYYKGMAYAAQGKTDAARQQLQLALRFNQNYEAARAALNAMGG